MSTQTGCTPLCAAVGGVSVRSGMLPLATSGSRIVDARGNAYRITGTALGGFQTLLLLDGTWNYPYRTIRVGGSLVLGIIDRLAQAGFNCVRLLICEDVCHPGVKPLGYINPIYNPDCFADPNDTATVLDAVRILDLVVAQCGRLGLRVVFDMHALAPDGNNAVATRGLWYSTGSRLAAASKVTHRTSDTRNEADWLGAWAALARRHVGNPVVIGADLVNEPWAATWGDGRLETDIRAAYTRCADAIHAVNPDWLVCCEGIYQTIDFGADGGVVGTGWGAGLTDAGRLPVTPRLAGRVVYSPHEYGPGVGPWAYFNAARYPANLNAVWDRMYGYLARQGIAPLWLGEIGDMLVAGAAHGRETPALRDKAVQWIDALMAYCAAGGLSWSWFAWAPNGYRGTPGSIADTNLLMGDYTVLNEVAMRHLRPNLAPLMLADIPVVVEVRLDRAPAQGVTVGWTTADGSALAGTHYGAARGVVRFAAGQMRATVTLMVTPLSRPGGTLDFFLVLHAPAGCRLTADRARVRISYASGAGREP